MENKFDESLDSRIHFFTEDEIASRRFLLGNSMFLQWIADNSEGKIKNEKVAFFVVSSLAAFLIVLFFFTGSMTGDSQVDTFMEEPPAGVGAP